MAKEPNSSNNPFANLPNADWLKDVSAFWTQGAAKGMPAGNAEMVERIRSFSRDSIAFMEERMKKDMDVARQIAEAKSPTDVAKINMDYIQGLIADYQRQATRVAEEAGKSMTAMWSQWQNKG